MKATPAPDAQPPAPMCWRGECQSGCYYPDCCSEDGAGRDECGHEWLDRPESDTRECLICGGVGTGAGEGATGQDTGTAWVTRSTDCPKAPAQAHPLATYVAEYVNDSPAALRVRVTEAQWNALEMTRKADAAERRAEEAEFHVEQLRDARDRAERRIEAVEALLDGWEHDGPDGHEFRLLIQRVREALDGGGPR